MCTNNVLKCCIVLCIVDGGWSNWSAGNCSKLCDGGNQTNIRTCSNPAPSCGGNNCIGKSVETVECNTMPCIGMHICYVISIFIIMYINCVTMYVRRLEVL